MSRILIVDGNPLIHRSAQIYAHLTTLSGTPTGCIYGALENLVRGVSDVNPTSIVVTWDFGKSRWRRELYPDYKISREQDFKKEAQPEVDWDSINEQMDATQDILEASGIHQVGVPGVEADDLIGILASGFAKSGAYDEIVIMAQDRDLYQLIDAKVSMYEPVQKKWIQEDDVRERYKGFGPKDLKYIKALTGDEGDDIPGIKGIGDGFAIKFLQKYGSLDSLLSGEHDDELKKTKKGMLLTDPLNKDIARMALQLVSIPVVDDWREYLTPKECDKLFQKLMAIDPSKVNQFEFAGICEQYELNRFMSSRDSLMRAAPDFDALKNVMT